MFYFNMNRAVGYMTAVLFLFIFILPQAFFWIKLPFLGLILLYTLINISSGRLNIYSSASFRYYYLVATITTAWLFIGAVNGNNPTALYDGFRLFVIYSIFYLLLITFLTNTHFYRYVVPITLYSSIGIAFIATYTLFDIVFGWNSIPVAVRSEMYMQAGLHSGYTQLNNVNIGMYTFLLPFLFSYIILDENKKSKFIYLVFFISIIALILASRRVVLYLIFLTPMICLCLDFFITSKLRLGLLTKVFTIYLYMAGIAFVSLITASYFNLFDIGEFLERFTEVVVRDDKSPRQLQLTSLLEGFYNNPIIGTGFGGVADVIRSEKGWNYELLYPKLLFHSGLLGTIILFAVMGYYTLKAAKSCKLDRKYYSINVSLLIGYLSVLMACATNPYLGSFDFLFAIGVPPLIIALVNRERLKYL